MNFTIDLASRYESAFGMMAINNSINKAFIESSDQSKQYNLQYYPAVSNDVEYVRMEIPGLDPLEFSSILTGERGNIFAPPVMMTFSQEKSLIETEVNDDDPIIIERWGTKPWDINIRGLLIDLNNRIYPSDEIRRLNQNWRYNGVVKVIGKQFEEKDIDTIYFKSIDFSGIEGYQDTIQFSIQAASIKGVNFTLLKPRRTGSVQVGNALVTNIER